MLELDAVSLADGIGGSRAVRCCAPVRALSLRYLLPQLVRGLDMLVATLVTIGPRRDLGNIRQSMFRTAPILLIVQLKMTLFWILGRKIMIFHDFIVVLGALVCFPGVS